MSIEGSCTEEGINRKGAVVVVLEAVFFIPAAQGLGSSDGCSMGMCILGGITPSSMSDLRDADIIFDVDQLDVSMVICGDKVSAMMHERVM